MAKPQTEKLEESSIIDLKTTVSYKGESRDAHIRIDANDIAKLTASKGGKIANESIAKIIKGLYDKTNENFKELVNK